MGVEMKQPAKKNDIKQDIERLILLGKKKGFLTYDEVNDALSDTVESSDEIDKVFDILDGKDIKIIESEEEGETAEKADQESREQEIRRMSTADIVRLTCGTKCWPVIAFSTCWRVFSIFRLKNAAPTKDERSRKRR